MSNTLDERVVVLRFDNKEFEANAQTSLGTLDKLDQKLQFKDVSKSLAGVSVASKDLGLGGISDAVEGLSKRFSALGIMGMTALQEITKSALHAGAGIVKGLFNPIIEGGKRRAFNLEQADFQLHGIIKNEKEVAAVLDSASKSVDGTAFSYDVAAKAAGQFAASGISAGEDLDAAMRAVAGTAATFNTDYEGVAQVFNKVASSGRMMGGEMLQLSQRGVPVAATLANYINQVNEGLPGVTDNVKEYVHALTDGMNITEADISEMSRKGVISFELLSAAMDNAFGKHAKDANKTFTGSLSNVKSALARIGAEFFQPLIKNEGPVVQLLNSVRVKINDIKEALKPLINLISNTLGKVIIRISKAIDSLDLTSKIEKIKEKFGLGKIADPKEAKKATSAINDVKKALKQVSEEEAKAAWDIWLKGTYGNGQERVKNLEAVGLSYRNTQDFVNALWKANFDLSKVEIEVGKNGKAAQEEIIAAQEQATKKTQEQVNSMSPLLKVWIGLKNIGQGLKNIGSNIAKTFKSIGKAFKNVFSAKGMSSGFMNLTERFAKFTESLKMSDKTAKNVEKAFTGFFKVLKLIGGAALKAGAAIGGALFKGLSFVASKLVAGAASLSDWVEKMGGFEGILNRIKTPFVNFINALKESEGFKKFREELEKIGNILKEKFLGTVDKVGGGMEKLGKNGFKLPSAEKVAEVFSFIFDKIAGFLSLLTKIPSAISKVAGFLKNGFKGITGLFNFGGGDGSDAEISDGGFLTKLKDFRDNIGKNIKEIFSSENLSEVGEAIKGFFVKIGEFFKGVDWGAIITGITSIVKIYATFKLIKSFTNMTEALRSVAGSISGVAKALKNRIKIDSVKTFAIAVGILAGALYVISLIPADKLQPSVEALMFCMLGMLAVMELVGRFANIDLRGIGIAFAGMGASLLMIAAAGKIIAGMSWDELAKAGVSILAVITMLTIASKIASTGGGLGFAGMALAVDLLVPMMLLLAKVPFTTVLAGVANLAPIMLALAGAARIANGAKGGAAAMLALSVSVILITPALLILSALPMDRAIYAASCLSGVMLALGGAAKLAASSKGAAGTMLAMALVVVAAAAAFFVMSQMDMDQMITAATSLGLLIAAIAIAAKLAEGSMSGALSIVLILGIVALVLGLLAKFTDLATLQGIVLSLCALLGTVATVIAILGTLGPQAGIMAALSLISFIGIMLIVGALIGKLMSTEFMKSGLKSFGDALHDLGEAFSKFAEGLTSRLPEIGANLQGFAENAKPFFDMLKGAGKEVLTGAGNLAGAILAFMAVDVLEALRNKIFKESTLPDVGRNLTQFWLAGLPFFTGIQTINPNAAQSAAALVNCISALMVGDVFNAIKKKLFGDSTLVDIGNQLVTFIKPLLTFAGSMSVITTEHVQAAGRVMGMLQVVSEKAKDIKEIKKIKGLKDNLPVLGEAVKAFADAVDGINVAVITTTTQAISSLVTSMQTIASVGDTNILAKFAGSLVGATEYFVKFSNTAASINSTGVVKLSTTVTQTIAINRMAGAVSMNGLLKITKGLNNYVKAFKRVTSSFKTLVGIALVRGQIKMIGQIVKDAQGIPISALTRFIESFNRAGAQGVSGFIKGMSGAAGQVRTAGANVSYKAIDGMWAANGNSSANKVGKDIGQGLINGMKAKEYAVYLQGVYLGKKSLQGMRDGGAVASPSKEGIRIGGFVGEGMVIGMERWMDRVYNAGHEMGRSTVDALGDSISKVSDYLNGGFSDDLTITPVLDLSNVEANAGQIGNILNAQNGIGIMGRLNSVSAFMRGGSVDSTNTDVVKAIGHLEDAIGNMPRNTTTINGMTYDDGSNVTDAIRQLFRAARIERRV